MRALLFYQEQKSKRVKKIKSKLYRKLRRKARDKHEKERREQLHATNPELAKEMDEEDARERAMERFSLRHKNMSRWAKTALKHGQVHAPGTKEAIEESLRIGQELKRKMQSRKADNDSSGSDSYFDDSDSDSEEDRDDGDNGGIRLRDEVSSSSSSAKSSSKNKSGSASSKALKLLAQIESDQVGEKTGSVLSQKKGLMSLKFMQNAVARQRENARAEALGLLAELEENDSDLVNDRTEVEQSITSESTQSICNIKTTSSKVVGRRQIGSEHSTTLSAKVKAKRKEVSQDMLNGSQSSVKHKGSILSSGVMFSGSVRTQMDGAVETTSSEMLLKPSVEEAKSKERSREKERVLEKEESWGGVATAWDGSDDAWLSIHKMEKGQEKEEKEEEEEDEEEEDEEEEEDGVAEVEEGASLKSDLDDDVPDVNNLSYRELQGELKKRGKKASGTKDSLVKALQKIFREEAAEKPSKISQKRKKRAHERDATTRTKVDSGGSDDDDDAGGWLSQQASNGRKPSKYAVGKEGSKNGGANLNVDAALSSVGATGRPSSTKKSDSHLDKLMAASGSDNDAARQNELVQMAFAVDNEVEAEFAAEKAEVVGEHANGGKKPEPVLAGWGSWTGSGALQAFPGNKKNGSRWGKGKNQNKRKRDGSDDKPVPAKRRDANLKHVIINEKRNKRAAKFLVAHAPHQFDSREQYERSIRNPVGPEWNTSDSHARMTRPKMIVRGGNVIAPIKMPTMYKRKLSTINSEFEAAQKAKRAMRIKNRNFKQ